MSIKNRFTNSRQENKGHQPLTRKSAYLRENLPNVEGPIERGSRRGNTIRKITPCISNWILHWMYYGYDVLNINTKSIKLLQEAGCEVTVIKEQTCCGALQNHSGETEITKKLAKENIQAFEKYDFDYIVNSIGGCGAQMVEYDKLLADDPEWASRAAEFARKSVDISVILGQLNLPFIKEISKVVTYQPSCHMTNVQKRVQEPLELLKKIPGITYMELPQKNMCCGSAGIYNIVNYEAAMDILDEKMKQVEKVSPEVIVTTNPGCHLQMKVGVEKEGLSNQIEVVHIVELLS